VILECSGIPLATQFLKNYPKEWGLATDTVFFLKNMAFGELGRQRILECKTIDHVLHVLWMSPEHAELVELSLNLFFDLSFSGGAKELTQTQYPVQFFLKLLKIHEKHVLPVKEIVRTMGRIYACSDARVQSMLVQEGVVAQLLPLFALHKTETTITHQLETVCSRIARLPVPPYEIYHQRRLLCWNSPLMLS